MSTYVYGIVLATDAPEAVELTGVGDPPASVRLVTHSGLAAIVSTTPDGLRAKRRDLAAHQEVLSRLARRGPVLPMRFGALAPDDASVEAELERAPRHYTGLLEELRDRVEVNVKATHVEETALRTVLMEDADLRATNEELRAANGGTPDEQMAFGERVSAALEELRKRDSDKVVAPLATHADKIAFGPPVDNCLANVSLLVHQDKLDDVGREASDLRESFDGLMEIRVNGPLPPYSFVTEPSPTD
ncbi:gas vesicle protein GvpL/GvpF [Murinocardiopsis flavida]|uniref:Gas vesicle protein GvpL/GvpF n=1 Tax=Murinocardiopsis flavida TaxID=645275 RepID=A0A2P8DL68_9ACTN|nr:GvpL/GvpF family gas vesicle protein [Murinocardiopsis flavida]PSK97972.1 gas vesicle protein GvpL/GvpF [Murinocardiopsis flavida]